MGKEISHKEFMKALKKRVEADLIISQYNLQESKKMVEKFAERLFYQKNNEKL